MECHVFNSWYIIVIRVEVHSCQVSLFHSETQDFSTPNFDNLTPKLGQGI